MFATLPVTTVTLLVGSMLETSKTMRKGGVMADGDDFNTKVIEEFRANDGKVGGFFEGAPMLLLHHNGAKTGTERVNPLMYQQVGGGIAIFASAGGGPSNPQWYRNLVAHSDTHIEIGADRRAVKAVTADPEERTRLWPRLVEAYADFDNYQSWTDREIPVIVLQPR